MAEASKIIRPIVAVLCIGVTVLGFINVYGNNAEVKAEAEAAACGRHNCSVKMTQNARNPIGQSFEFQIDHSQNTATVECSKTFLLIGDWKCERTSGPPPTPSASASAAPSAR